MKTGSGRRRRPCARPACQCCDSMLERDVEMFELSVVIPTVNRAKSLAACLAATGNATQATCEIIVVDGASTDGTTAILERCGEMMGDRLQVVREPVREGFVRAANKGFRAARGRY